MEGDILGWSQLGGGLVKFAVWGIWLRIHKASQVQVLRNFRLVETNFLEIIQYSVGNVTSSLDFNKF